MKVRENCMLDVKELYEQRNNALLNLRFGHKLVNYYRALKIDEQLVEAVAAKRKDPPNPKRFFVYEKVAYLLQSYKNGTALYVREDLWDENKYIFIPPDKKEKVRNELSIRAQIEYELQFLQEMFPNIQIEDL